MIALSQFHSAVATHVPTAPLPTLDEALVNSAIDFCTRTQLVQEVLEADGDAGEFQVEFLPSSDDLAVRFISQVWYKGTLLVPVANPYVQSSTALLGTAPTGPSSYVYGAEANSITVYPPPDADDLDAFTAQVVLIPTRTATTLPDVLYNEWLTTIAAGARAYVKSIPGQPFSGDPTADLMMFNRGMSAAMMQSLKGRVNGTLAVRRGPGARAFFPKNY